jgi:hypothetical protein
VAIKVSYGRFAAVIAFILLGMIVGALLGLRWAVLALLPAGVIMLVAIGGAAAVLGSTIWWIAAATLLSMIGLQIGYLMAAVLRYAAPPSVGVLVQGELGPGDEPRMRAP